MIHDGSETKSTISETEAKLLQQSQFLRMIKQNRQGVVKSLETSEHISCPTLHRPTRLAEDMGSYWFRLICTFLMGFVGILISSYAGYDP